MKLNETPTLGMDFDRLSFVRLIEYLRQIALKVNQMSTGSVNGFDGGGTAAPTTGTWAQGDRWRNTAPTELGAVSSKYVVDGWVCTVSGTPGTWVQSRSLTGN